MPKKTEELTHPERPTEIAGRFKTERERLNVTFATLTKKTGVNRFSIGRFESGERGIGSDALLCLLFALAEEGARLDYIITGRSSTARVALAESSAEALADLIAAKLKPGDMNLGASRVRVVRHPRAKRA